MRNNDLAIPNIDAESILAFQATFLNYASLHEATTAYVTDVAVQYGFERVSVGVVQDASATLIALSHENTETKSEQLHQRLMAALAASARH